MTQVLLRFALSWLGKTDHHTPSDGHLIYLNPQEAAIFAKVFSEFMDYLYKSQIVYNFDPTKGQLHRSEVFRGGGELLGRLIRHVAPEEATDLSLSPDEGPSFSREQCAQLMTVD